VIGLDTIVLARKLIESGKRLYLSKSVVLELEWVLRGYYKSTVADVLTVLRQL
jgi:predicted nucleic-acid-binding protein